MTLLTISTIGYGAAPEPVDLQLRLTKGMAFNQRVTLEQTIIQQIQNRTLQIHQTMHFDYRHEVLSVDELGNAEVRMTYKAVHVKQEGIGGAFEYDSQNSAGEIPLEAQGWGALIGTELTVHISSKGDILLIQGLDQMFNQIVKKFKSPTGAQLAALKQIYSTKNMTGAIGQLVGPYPRSPVEIGDIWSMNTETLQNFPMVTDNYYKVIGRKDGRVSIAVSSNIYSPVHAEPVQMGSLNLLYSISGHGSGSILMGERTGLVLREKLTREFSGHVKVEDLQRSSSAIWPISVKTSMVREIKEG